MKHLLLASASIVAFAGAASAEVTFGGEATLGYNDTDNTWAGNNDLGDEYGFYYDADLNVTLSQELDNGLTASATFGLQIDEDTLDNASDNEVFSSDYLLSLTAGEAGGLYFGDIEFSPVAHWKSAGVMIADGFSEQDGENVLRGDVNYGNIKASFSTPVEGDTTAQFGFAVAGDFGTYNAVLAYQEEGEIFDEAGDDYNRNEILALSAGTTFAGATARLGYATTDYVNGQSQDSLGVSVTYPVGALALTGAIVSEDGDRADGTTWQVKGAYKADGYSITADYQDRADSGVRWAIEGGYDLKNGLNVYAGLLGRDAWASNAYYVAGEYDLGKGAKLIASYADADETNNGYLVDDEVGARAYQNGTTLELSFKF